MNTPALLIRPSTPADLPAITAIYGWNVLNGTGTFELDAPDEAEMTRRRDDVLSKDLPWIVVERGGEELWKRVLARLPPPDAAALGKVILVISAYPLALNARLDQAIAAELSPDDPDRVFLEMGRASADANLQGTQKAFVQEGDPHHLLEASGMI